MNKLELLRDVIGEDFVKINSTNYKSERGDAIIVQSENLIELVREKVKEEIPYLDREILRKYLPDNLQSDLLLSDLQELAKFDHTLISRHITDDLGLAYEVLNTISAAELVMSGSDEYTSKGYVIFYLQNEQ